MAFSGEDDIVLPGQQVTAKANVSADDFLIAQLNRFKGPSVQAGQSLGESKLSFGGGISSTIAIDALTVVIRRLQGSVQAIADEGARKLLADARNLMMAGDASGAGLMIQYVKANVVAIGNTVAGYADSLGLPPASFPLSVGGLSGTKLLIAAGAVGVVGLLLLRRSR